MNDIIKRIQQDILDKETSLIDVLLKAKVLAFQLKNDEFTMWVRNELDGYETLEGLPDYRILHSLPKGSLTNGARWYHNMPVDVSYLPDDLRDRVTKVFVREGIRAVEELAQNDKNVFSWPQHWVNAANSLRNEIVGDGFDYRTEFMS